MPNPELSTISVRQISQFPSVSAVDGGDLLLLQSGGLGGPYQTVAAASLVATALASSTDEMVIAGTLGVGGDLGVGGAFSVTGNTFMAGNLNIAGLLSTDGPFDVNSSADISGDLTVGGALTASGQVTFGYNCSVDGSLTVGEGIYSGGPLEVIGPTTLKGGMGMAGPLYVSGGGSFVGDLMTGGGLATGGAAKFGGGIYTFGSITAEGGVGLLECLSVGKDATIGGDTAIAGNLRVTNCAKLGPTGITGDLDLFGNLCLAGNLVATGQAKLDVTDLKIRGDGCIVGNLGVMGLIDAGSGYFKTAIATDGNAKIQGGLYVGGPSTFGEPVMMLNDLTVNGRVGICGTFHLNGQAVATELWVRGYVCHVGSDLLDAITDVSREMENYIRDELDDETSRIRQWIDSHTVTTFNNRSGHVDLRADDIANADGVLKPPVHPTNWYAWRNNAWATFEPGGGGPGGGIPEPEGTGLFGRRVNGGYGWDEVAPRPPSHATNYYAWHDDQWTAFEPGGGASGIADVPFGSAPQARVFGAWQPTVPQPPGSDGSYYALRDGAWASFDPSAGGGGGITQEDLDNALANYLSLAGGALAGNLAVGGNLTVSGSATIPGYLPLGGGALTGALTLPSDASGNQAVRYSQMSAALGAYATTAAMTTAIGTATAGMATQTWTSGQISSATSGMATQTWVGDQIAGFATQSWVSGQITGMATQTYVGQQISSATADMATQTWTGQQISSAIAALPTPANTLQFSLVIPGKPAAGQVYNIPITVPCQLAAGLAGGAAFQSTMASASQAFTVTRYVGGTATVLGTVTFPNNTNMGQFSGDGGTLAVGNRLQIAAPGTQDATMADIGISLLATRT